MNKALEIIELLQVYEAKLASKFILKDEYDPKVADNILLNAGFSRVKKLAKAHSELLFYSNESNRTVKVEKSLDTGKVVKLVIGGDGSSDKEVVSNSHLEKELVGA